MHEYTLKRSKRKTVSLQITRDLAVLVRAPMRMPQKEIDRFVETHDAWIALNKNRLLERGRKFPEPTQEELAVLRERAVEYIAPRVGYYAGIMELEPAGVKITSARTRFGSCSGKNSLCFSCRLMRYPLEAVDYVVVHELAHIVHKNHGREFYSLIESVLPDYKERRRLLKGVN